MPVDHTKPKSRLSSGSPLSRSSPTPEPKLGNSSADAQATRVNKTQSLTPDPIDIEQPLLGESPAKTTTVIRKRKAALDDENDDSFTRNGESSYDATPRTSPILEDNTQLPLNGTGAAVNAQSGAAPKRAPRKKRKWLKRGEGELRSPLYSLG